MECCRGSHLGRLELGLRRLHRLDGGALLGRGLDRRERRGVGRVRRLQVLARGLLAARGLVP